MFYSQLVYFVVIWYVVSVAVCCTKKNLATLICCCATCLKHDPSAPHVLVLDEDGGVLAFLARHLHEELAEAVQGHVVAVEVGGLKRRDRFCKTRPETQGALWDRLHETRAKTQGALWDRFYETPFRPKKRFGYILIPKFPHKNNRYKLI
jgi:hypothetical protein